MDELFNTVVIGGGQAGLAASYYLSQFAIDHVVLEASSRIGEPWRRRWDSLRLFTPAKFDGLPGAPFPGEDFSFPSKNEVAEYLEEYVRRFHLPLRLNTSVRALARIDRVYRITTGTEELHAKNVIIATGPYQRPFIPAFASELDPGIAQMHSHEYRHPSQLPEGEILVVGAGNSGTEIAMELLQSGRKVLLAGRNVGSIPANVIGRIFGGRPYWFLISQVLNVRTAIGRKVRARSLRQGTPLIRLTLKDVTRAGAIRCARVSAAWHGRPQLDDGKVLDVNAVVWATGYRYDFSWITLPVIAPNGHPLQVGGIVPNSPGLYFLGLHFQIALTSAFLGGVGADARAIAHMIRSGGRRSFRPLARQFAIARN